MFSYRVPDFKPSRKRRKKKLHKFEIRKKSTKNTHLKPDWLYNDPFGFKRASGTASVSKQVSFQLKSRTNRKEQRVKRSKQVKKVKAVKTTKLIDPIKTIKLIKYQKDQSQNRTLQQKEDKLSVKQWVNIEKRKALRQEVIKTTPKKVEKEKKEKKEKKGKKGRKNSL